MKKHILFISIMILLLVGIGITIKLYPIYQAYQKLTKSDCINFDGSFRIINTNTISADSLFELLPEGNFSGEYIDGKFHGFLYTEGIDIALLEFYRDIDGNIMINISQMIKFGVNYMDTNTSLPTKQLFNFIDNSAECFVSEEQFESITGIAIIPDFFSSDIAENNSKSSFAGLILSNKISYKNAQFHLELSNLGNLDVPVDLSVTLTVPNDGYTKFEIPKSSIEDDQIWIYQIIFKKVMDIVDENDSYGCSTEKSWISLQKKAG